MRLSLAKEKIKKLVGDEFILLDESLDINTHSKVKIKHCECGNVLEMTLNKFFQRKSL